MLRRTLHAACLLALCCLAARAQEAKPGTGDESAGLIYGEGYAFVPAFRKLVSSYRFISDKVTGAK